MTDLKDHVRARYGAIASQSGRLSCGCGSAGCCGGATQRARPVPDLGASDGQTLPPAIAATGLGCGDPNALAQLVPGEVVLDLGCGGGLDALYAAQRVAPHGRVYGLDMTPEMIELAKRNQRKTNITNVEFLLGDIEAIPLPDESVDVVISNCVINLVPDKDAALREAHRVLKPGGRLAIADPVFRGNPAVPAELRQRLDGWIACVSGALTESEYAAKLKAAGFTEITIDTSQGYDAGEAACCTDWPRELSLASGYISARKSASAER